MKAMIGPIALMVLVVLPFGGCNNDPPGAQYPVNLGTADAPLLPLAQPVLGSRDPRILSGTAQAELVKRGDTESAAAARAESTPIKPMEANIPPASSFAEAMQAVGRTFVHNLAAPPGAAGGAPPAAGEPPKPEREPAADGGKLAEADQKAIEQLVVRVNEAASSGKFSGLNEVVAAEQKDAAAAVAPLLEELLVSARGVAAAIEKSSAGFKAKAEGKLSAALGAWSVTGLASGGADVATGQLSVGGGEAKLLQFKREGGQWRVVHPFLPAPAELEAAKTALQAAVDDLDGLMDKASSGSADAAAGEAKIDAAAALIRKYCAGA